MSHPSIGIIGGGRIARILLGGWRCAGVDFAQVAVCEPDDAAFVALQTAAPSTPLVRGEATEVAKQTVVFLAVHPPQVPEAAAPIAGQLREGAVAVSLAPKITLAKLRSMLGGFGRLARLIPNAPSLVGRGFNPIAWGDELNDADRQLIRSILAPLGELPEVEEETLEAYAILAAMGPTYFWPQWLELESLAIEFGLQQDSARRALCAMTVGALDMLASAGMKSDEVADLIPVKPLADFEPELRAAYRGRLTALFEKIHP
ncbi:MAG: NAD(P)-binding domain-containing protein [Planctomycetales bacterium]|nr:NAD(P)-binding domain-containing protein [Planctomycetales bacterium]